LQLINLRSELVQVKKKIWIDPVKIQISNLLIFFFLSKWWSFKFFSKLFFWIDSAHLWREFYSKLIFVWDFKIMVYT
jgi:hypothetical protein